MIYTVTSPWLFSRVIYPSLTWRKQENEKVLYLTFDDGPHPEATPFVLQQLRAYNAKGTFFCIGKNVAAYPDIYNRLLDEGHRTGNHTFDHLNGWKTSNADYLENILRASQYIDSRLFRPPYGRITREQVKILQKKRSLPGKPELHSFPAFQIVMWSVLTGDFDTGLSPDGCLRNAIRHSKPGSIIVFHDSTKAWDRMRYALPRMLEHFTADGFTFRSL